MNLRKLMDEYADEGLTRALAASRVCQDIVLKALAEGMETDPALYVAAMISLHMRPLHAWNNSEKMREVDGKLLGETLYEDVWKLNACDKNARLK